MMCRVIRRNNAPRFCRLSSLRSQFVPLRDAALPARREYGLDAFSQRLPLFNKIIKPVLHQPRRFPVVHHSIVVDFERFDLQIQRLITLPLLRPFLPQLDDLRFQLALSARGAGSRVLSN